MRILHVITVFERGGAQAVVIELARSQLAAGHEVGVMAGTGGAAWEELPSAVTAIHEASFRKAISPLDDLAGFLAIRRALADFRPDILHLHSSKAGTLGRLAGLGMRRRVVYTVHGFDTIRLGHPRWLPVERALAGACEAIVAVNDYDRVNLEACGIRRALLVRNGIRDFSADPPHPRRDIARAFEADRAAGRRVVVTMARLAVPKRFDLFAAAAELLRGEDFSFYWLGNLTPPPGPLPPRLRAMGDVPDAKLLLREADIFCLLSDYEGAPISVIEALCAGKPVVASDIGGIREVAGGDCAILVPNEAAAVAEGLRRAAREGATLGEAGRRRYLGRYGLEGMASGYEAIYSGLPGPRGRGES